MPGVNRPYTLVDVLGAINQQSQSQGNELVSGFGDFAETDEQAAIAESIAITHQADPGWDQGTWGTFVWN